MRVGREEVSGKDEMNGTGASLAPCGPCFKNEGHAQPNHPLAFGNRGMIRHPRSTDPLNPLPNRAMLV